MRVEFKIPRADEGMIELTPLIDVIFQLLVFFMLSSSFLYPALDLVLPRLDNLEQESNPPLLVINLDQHGHLFLNSTAVAPEQLEEVLRQRLAEIDDRSVFLRADTSTPYGTILEVMKTANTAGALQFNFLYEDTSSEP